MLWNGGKLNLLSNLTCPLKEKMSKSFCQYQRKNTKLAPSCRNDDEFIIQIDNVHWQNGIYAKIILSYQEGNISCHKLPKLYCPTSGKNTKLQHKKGQMDNTWKKSWSYKLSCCELRFTNNIVILRGNTSSETMVNSLRWIQCPNWQNISWI